MNPNTLLWNRPQMDIFYLLQARWITVCSNILRLYMQTAKPSQKLIKLVKYIILVYCPILFDIKWKPEATNGKTEFLISYSYTSVYLLCLRSLGWNIFDIRVQKPQFSSFVSYEIPHFLLQPRTQIVVTELAFSSCLFTKCF